MPKTDVQDWTKLTTAFIKQYGYNVKMEVTRRDLENLRQREGDSFRNFVARWRSMAGMMTSRPSEKEQCRMILKSMLPKFQDAMYMVSYPDFDSLYE